MMLLSRRALLATTSVAAVVVLLPPQLGLAADSGEPGAFVFFRPEEAAFVDAAVARLIPTDENGPGAREAGVVHFIDQQLKGDYGAGTKWYLQGPFAQGIPEQGYQSALAPAAAYRAAAKGIDDYCRKTFGGKRFAELASAQQDEVLESLEQDKIALSGISAKTFFDLLHENTLEGFFCDPLYGGNRDMVGWKLIGFPGARGDYIDFIEKHNEPYPLPPVGLQGHRM